MSRLFISHSSRNNAEALALAKWLEDHGWAKGDVFLDIDPEHGLVAGQRWMDELIRAAGRCEAVICLITHDWLASSYCRVELNVAKSRGKQVFGAICRPTPLEDIASKVPELTGQYQIVDLAAEGAKEAITVPVPPDGHEETVHFRRDGLVRLRTGLKKAGIDAKTFAFNPKRQIFPGLKALEEEDAAIFFGRDGKIVEGLDALRKSAHQDKSPVFAIVGASGSGKSSFLRAGLFPRLERDDRHWLPIPVIRPVNDVLSNREGLYAALERRFASLGQPRALGDIRHQIETQRGLAPIVDELRRLAHGRLLDEDAPLPTVVLPIDQGEELFDPQQTEASQLLNLIAGVHEAQEADRRCASETKDAEALRRLHAEPPRLVVVLTIRSDNFEKLQRNDVLTPAQGAIFSLPPMPKTAFKDVIEGPVRRRNEASDTPLRLDERLVDQLLADVGGESADALPLLAFVLERLFTDYAQSGTLTFEHYDRSGRLEGAIVAAVKKAFDDDPTDEKTRNDLLRRAFIPWLARIDEASGEVKRNVARWDDIPAKAQPLVERLIKVRLLRSFQPTGEDDKLDLSQTRTVEPAHEALLRQWPALVAWIKEEHGSLYALETLLRAAKDWHDHERAVEWLTHKAGRLIDAEALSRRKDYERKIDGLPRQYLSASRETEDAARRLEREQIERERRQLEDIVKAQGEREKASRQRIFWSRVALAIGSVAVVVVVWLALSARITENEALVAQSRFLARDARTLALAGEVETAVLVSQAALPYDATPDRPMVMEALRALFLAKVELRVVSILRGHEGSVHSAAVSPNGTRVLTASLDKTARLWDAGTGKEIAVLRGHERGVLSAAFSPDGTRVVTASEDKTARLWDAGTGKEIAVLRGHENEVRSAAFSPDGTRVVTASWDKTTRLWDAGTGKEIAVLRGHEDGILSAAFSPDGARVVTASSDKTARLWDARTGKEITVLRGHKEWVWSAVFSPDGARVVTASREDTTALLWDAGKGKEIAVLRGHEDGILSAAFSPDGARVVTASRDKTARLWDAGTGKEIAVLRGHESLAVSAAFSPDGTRVVTASGDKTARLWDAETGKEITALRGHHGLVQSATFSPDGTRVVTASFDNTARLWHAGTGKEIAVLRGHEDYVRAAAFSPDGARVVTASNDKTARLWHARTGKEIAVLRGHENWVVSAAFSHDGKRVVTASHDKTARLWEAGTGKETAVLRHESEVSFAAFSPDGVRVVTASSDKTARLWDARTGKEVAVLRGHGGGILSAAFSRDGARVATASNDNTARLWDAGTGKEIGLLRWQENGSYVFSAAFSPDGARVVTTFTDKTARVWDAGMGKEVAVLLGHEDHILSATFSPDGTRVVTASTDTTARLWHAGTGKELAVLRGHKNWVWSAAFSPDGTRVVTASWDKTARLWDVSENCRELIDWAWQTSEKRHFTLSATQRERYFLSDDSTRRAWRVSRVLDWLIPRGGDPCP